MKNPEKLLDLLAQDARLTPAQLAAMLGETEEDVALRSTRMRRIRRSSATRPWSIGIKHPRRA